MTTNRLFPFSLILLALTIVGCGEETPSVKQMAPDFTIKTFDGGDFRLSEHRGKRIALNFFASWCTTCGSEIPDIEKSHQAHTGENILFVGVAIDDTEDKAREFVKKFGLTYTIGIDEDGSIKKNYAIYGLPFTFFINQDGFINYIHAGAVNESLLASELKKMIKSGGPDPKDLRQSPKKT